MDTKTTSSPTSRRSLDKERGRPVGVGLSPAHSPHEQSRGRRPAVSPQHMSGAEGSPIKTPSNPAEVFDALERENENIVNKLQREISQLRHERSRSRSQSTSSSCSVSRNPSIKSVYSPGDGHGHGHGHSSASSSVGPEDSGPGALQRSSRGSFSNSEDSSLVHLLRKENEMLKNKLADLSIKLTEKDSEIESLHKLMKGGRAPAPLGADPHR